MCKKLVLLFLVLGLAAGVANAASYLLEDGESARTFTDNTTASGSDISYPGDNYWDWPSYTLNGVQKGAKQQSQNTTDKVAGTGSWDIGFSTAEAAKGQFYRNGIQHTNLQAYRGGMDLWVKPIGPATLTPSRWTKGTGTNECKFKVILWTQAAGGWNNLNLNSGSITQTNRRDFGIQLYGGISRDIDTVGWQSTPSLFSFNSWHHVNAVVANDANKCPVEWNNPDSAGNPTTDSRFTTIDGYCVNLRETSTGNKITPDDYWALRDAIGLGAIKYIDDCDYRSKGGSGTYSNAQMNNSWNDIESWMAQVDYNYTGDWSGDLKEFLMDEVYLMPEPATLILLGLGGLLLRRKR